MPQEPLVRRTATTLADGRELIYYDDSEPYLSGGATRRLDDPRPLPDRFVSLIGAPAADDDGDDDDDDGGDAGATALGPTLRRDPLNGEWVAMAAHRMNRTFLPPADANPLAPAAPGAAYQDGEIPAEDYDVVVFENRFPSLLTVPGVIDEVTHPNGQAVWATRPGVGRCEVICFSADPTTSLAKVGPRRMRTIIEAWADRTAALSQLPEVEQVYCFENRGKEIGVTLHHPHGQIYAFPYVTPYTRRMLDQAAEYRDRTGGHLLTDVLTAELEVRTRVVLETEHWVGYVPFAARWPVEVHLAPRRTVPDLPALSDAERTGLGTALLDLLAGLDRFHVDPETGPIALPYIAAWHQAPVRDGRDLARLHLQVFSVLRAPRKLKYLAGSESGMGAWVSDTLPERIAARLREVMA